MAFFELSEQEERSFLSLARHSVLDGPQTLVRFSDSNRMKQGPCGRYWMYGTEIAEALSAHSGDRLLREPGSGRLHAPHADQRRPAPAADRGAGGPIGRAGPGRRAAASRRAGGPQRRARDPPVVRVRHGGTG